MRGDIRNRYAAYAVGRQWGWLSADDIREKENMNPLPNGAGKVYLVPANDGRRSAAGSTQSAGPSAPNGEPQERPADNPPAGERSAPEPVQASALIAAQRAVFVETMGRMARKEGNALRRAAKRADGLRTWMTDFYERHDELLQEVLLPAVRSHLVLRGSSDEPAAVTRRLAAAYVRESCRMLHELLDAATEQLDVQADALASRWEIERSAAVAVPL